MRVNQKYKTLLFIYNCYFYFLLGRIIFFLKSRLNKDHCFFIFLFLLNGVCEVNKKNLV